MARSGRRHHDPLVPEEQRADLLQADELRRAGLELLERAAHAAVPGFTAAPDMRGRGSPTSRINTRAAGAHSASGKRSEAKRASALLGVHQGPQLRKLLAAQLVALA